MRQKTARIITGTMWPHVSLRFIYLLRSAWVAGCRRRAALGHVCTQPGQRGACILATRSCEKIVAAGLSRDRGFENAGDMAGRTRLYLSTGDFFTASKCRDIGATLPEDSTEHDITPSSPSFGAGAQRSPAAAGFSAGGMILSSKVALNISRVACVFARYTRRRDVWKRTWDRHASWGLTRKTET